MEFQLKYDNDLYTKHMMQYFEVQWTKTKSASKKLLYLAIAVFLIGVALECSDKHGDTFVYLAISLAALWWVYYRMYISGKKRTITANQKFLLKHGDKEIDTIVFTDDYFHLINEDSNIKLGWKHFSGYRVINDVLYVISDIGFTFIIPQILAGPEVYTALLDTVAAKVGNKLGW